MFMVVIFFNKTYFYLILVEKQLEDKRKLGST